MGLNKDDLPVTIPAVGPIEPSYSVGGVLTHHSIDDASLMFPFAINMGKDITENERMHLRRYHDNF
jgi:hypothetical protein